tara:strand:- start:314 stop:508 length:195 start_codon:yes stop_codon:yes gene_type:complete
MAFGNSFQYLGNCVLYGRFYTTVPYPCGMNQNSDENKPLKTKGYRRKKLSPSQKYELLNAIYFY